MRFLSFMFLFIMAVLTGCSSLGEQTTDPCDLDNDGVCESAGDKVLGFQPYTLDGQGRFPLLALDKSLVSFDDGGYNGYGCQGEDGDDSDWWGEPCFEMKLIDIDPDSNPETKNVLSVYAVEVTHEGVYRGNFKNAACQDPLDQDADGYKCWGNLEDESDPLVVKYDTLREDVDFVKGLCFDAVELVNDDGALELQIIETTDGCEATGEPS